MTVIICLEEKNYSRKVLLKGAFLAKKYGCKFGVVFFYSIENRYTMFHLLNIAESKRLSKRLGAVKFALKRTENNRDTAQELVKIAKNNDVKKIIMSGASSKNSVKKLFRSRFFFEKYNYIIKNMPNIVLVMINRNENNPIGKVAYENGRQGYLVKKNDNKTFYFLSDKRFRGKDIPGFFFHKKDTDKCNGIFAFILNGKISYVHIHHGKTRYIKHLNTLQ